MLLPRQIARKHVSGRATAGLRGFTLMELLVVMAVIILLMGLSFPVLRRTRDNARFARARSEIMILQQAWLAYWNTYGEFPASGLQEMDTQLVATLGGDNDYNIAFIEFDAQTRIEGMLDPWGRPYMVDFETAAVSMDRYVFRTRVTLLHGL